MPTYRSIVQGEGIGADGAWFGFYAGRQAHALRSDVAEAAVLADVRRDWTEGKSADLGKLDAVAAVCRWRAGLVSWPPLSNRGHIFYDDSAEAQREAFDIEAKASRVPRTVRTQHQL